MPKDRSNERPAGERPQKEGIPALVLWEGQGANHKTPKEEIPRVLKKGRSYTYMKKGGFHLKPRKEYGLFTITDNPGPCKKIKYHGKVRIVNNTTNPGGNGEKWTDGEYEFLGQ
jgi:hypothetical protein